MPARVRPVIDLQPVWDLKFEGWARKFFRRNKWKLNPTLDVEDFVQEAFLVFKRVLDTYPLESRPNVIMGLFKVSMSNRLKDMAKEWTEVRQAEIPFETLLAEELKIVDTLGEENNEGMLRVIISEWPPEVRAALAILTSSEKMAKLRKSQELSSLAKLAGFEPKRETLNEALSRIIRLPKTVDLLGMIRSALTSSEEIK